MSIFTLLKEDHREAVALLKKIEKTNDNQLIQRKKWFDEIHIALGAHSRAEEKAVYDVVKDKNKTHDMIMEGFEEHHVLDHLLEEISTTQATQDAWIAKITVLREILEHHIEEEEDDLFKEIKSLCKANELKEMEANFKKFKSKELADKKQSQQEADMKLDHMGKGMLGIGLGAVLLISGAAFFVLSAAGLGGNVGVGADVGSTSLGTSAGTNAGTSAGTSGSINGTDSTTGLSGNTTGTENNASTNNGVYPPTNSNGTNITGSSSSQNNLDNSTTGPGSTNSNNDVNQSGSASTTAH